MEKVGGIVVALLIAGGIFWFKSNSANNFGDEVHAAAHEVIETLPDYAQNADLYDQYLLQAHERCFDRHYRMGSRRTGSKFDEDGYWGDVFSDMSDIAFANKQADMSKNIDALDKRFNGG